MASRWWPVRRRAQPADLYESAAIRLDRARRAKQEYGDLAAPSAGADLPVRPRMKLVLVLFALALLYGIVQSARNNVAPKLAADCEHSRLALSTASVRQGSPMRWTATGPAEGTVIVAVDVARFTRSADGTLQPEPAAGHRLEETQAASYERELTGCRGSGQFGVTVPEGRHTVTLFRLSATGSEPVASAPLEVSER